MAKVKICEGCKGARSVPCPICNGTGSIWQKEITGLGAMVDCKSCQGTGKLLCNLCGGVGKVLTDEP